MYEVLQRAKLTLKWRIWVQMLFTNVFIVMAICRDKNNLNRLVPHVGSSSTLRPPPAWET